MGNQGTRHERHARHRSVARALSILLGLGVLTGCALTGSAPSPDPTGTVAPSASAPQTPSPAAPPDGDPTRSPTPRPEAANDARPNLIVVLTDDMRADDLGHMPRTQQLMVARGMTFTDAISPHPLCCPARAELLTGQYAQNNGVRHNTGQWGAYPALDPSNTVATWFSAGGYATAMTGKHVNHYKPTSPRDPGWDTWQPLAGTPTDYFDFRFHDGGSYVGDYVTNRIEDRANTIVEDNAGPGQPFFAYINHVAPHERQNGELGLVPAPPEPQHADYATGVRAPMRDLASFQQPVRGGLPARMRAQTATADAIGEISEAEFQHKWEARVRSLQSVDEAIASLYATLEATGELDNTFVFFTSDNGYALGENNFYRKDLLIDPVLSVPLVVTGPGVGAGSTSDLPVTLVDVVATLSDLSDVAPQHRLDGLSFAGTLTGAKNTPWRDTTLIQTGSRTGGKYVGDEYPGWGIRGVRTARYAYGRDVNTGEQMLFDHVVDPLERRNLAAAERYSGVVDDLDERTNALLNCTGAGCNRTFGPDPAPAEQPQPDQDTRRGEKTRSTGRR